MNEPTIERPPEAPPPAAGRPAYAWRPWKIAGIALAGLLVVAGGVLTLLGGFGSSSPESTNVAGGEGGTSSGGIRAPLGTGGETGGAESLLPGGIPVPSEGPREEPGETPPGETPPGETETAPVPTGEGGGIEWSPALLRGGVSFFVAFAVAFAFRAFVRIGLIFVGIWAATLFLLARIGWVEVHWDIIDVWFQARVAGLSDEFESFGRFITGSLPSASMAGLGLFTGLRRR
jgi:uncharacterized membrane protein (Fun14 family)